MACCGKRTPPSNILDFTHLGCPCDTWAHLKDQFIYLKDERAGVIPCKTDQFTVKWTGIDAMTYLMVVTDNLTGETCEYSVTREHTFESPMQAFERDWREKEIRYNRGIKRAVDDTLEAFEELNPNVPYKLSYDRKGYKIHRPIKPDLGIVLWKIDYGIEANIIPVPLVDWHIFYPDNEITLPDVAPEIGALLVLLIKRMRKAGVSFSHVDYKVIGDYKSIEIVGASYRDANSRNTIKIVYQEMDLDNHELRTYHEYYTDKGPQNGFYNC